jgi:hypothetical protein
VSVWRERERLWGRDARREKERGGGGGGARRRGDARKGCAAARWHVRFAGLDWLVVGRALSQTLRTGRGVGRRTWGACGGGRQGGHTG